MVPFMPSPLEQTEKQPPEKTIFSCTHIPHIWMQTTWWEVKESKREMAAPMQEREGIQASCITSYGCWVIVIFINCGRERSQHRKVLHFRCARHTQTDQRAKSDIWTSSTKLEEEKVTGGGRYPRTTFTCLYFQVLVRLVSFLDSSGFVTIAKPNRTSQQTIVFRFFSTKFPFRFALYLLVKTVVQAKLAFWLICIRKAKKFHFILHLSLWQCLRTLLCLFDLKLLVCSKGWQKADPCTAETTSENISNIYYQWHTYTSLKVEVNAKA